MVQILFRAGCWKNVIVEDSRMKFDYSVYEKDGHSPNSGLGFERVRGISEN